MSRFWIAGGESSKSSAGGTEVSVKTVSNVTTYPGPPPRTQPSSNTAPLAEYQWRRAVLAVYQAQRAYHELLADHDAPDHLVDRAWLVLWRAERHRDHILAHSHDWTDD